MVDDVLLTKIASIERCVARAREEYDKDRSSFASDFTRQDAAILNIQRACETSADLGSMILRRYRLGVPQSARDIFLLLGQANWIDAGLAESLARMVGYRNIAIHEYKTLQLSITIAVIEHHLEDFLIFCRTILSKAAIPGPSDHA